MNTTEPIQPLAERDAGELLKPREAARLARCHLCTLYDWIARGWLPAVRRGPHRVFVLKRDVLAMFRPVEPLRLDLPPDPQAPGARVARQADDNWADGVLRRSGFDV